MLVRRCQVLFKYERIYQFRRPTIWLCSLKDLGLRRFFLKGYCLYRLLFWYVINFRYFRHLTFIIVRNSGDQDIGINMYISMVLRYKTRRDAIRAYFLERLNLFAFAICFMGDLSRETFFITSRMRTTVNLIVSWGQFCFVNAFDRLLCRVSSRTMPMRIQMSIFITGRARIFKMRLGVIRCIFTSVVE